MLEIKNSSSLPAPRILYVTAGAGGMFCGSCLHDNALAGALIDGGHDVILVPAYTPIRTESTDHSVARVVFGGVNLYLRHRYAPFRWLPAAWTQWLDRPGLIRRLVGNRVETDPAQLGNLTLAMLRGPTGMLARDVAAFVRTVEKDFRPDLIVFSNLLMAGAAPVLRDRVRAPIVTILQGDDLFVDGLPAPFRAKAVKELQRIAASVDRFLVHSQYYAQHLASMLSIPSQAFSVVPLGLAAAEAFRNHPPAASTQRPPTIGFLARFAPEKGLHLLCESFVRLKRMPGAAQVRLRIAGWHGPRQQHYLQASLSPIQKAGYLSDVEIVGEVDLIQKQSFLRTLDVLSVPSPYADPKGLYILEALASGVPVVQPNHGAFPELLASTGGGRLFAPNDLNELTQRLSELVTDRPQARRLGMEGQRGVLARHTIKHTADITWSVLQSLLDTPRIERLSSR